MVTRITLQLIAPPKFSNVDISLEEFLFFLEDIGMLKTTISIEDVSFSHHLDAQTPRVVS